MNKQPLIIAVLILIAAITACTEVDLCDDAEHPHRAHVIFNYNWNPGDTRLPDSMVIAAVRIVNLWKCGIIYNHRTDSGRYIVNAPQTIPVWADPDTYYPPPPPPTPSGYTDIVANEPEPTTPPPVPTRPEAIYQHYALREGTYKFLTLNKDAKEIIIDPVYQYLTAPNEEMQTTDITISYRTYDLNDPALRQISQTKWEDSWNTGFRYIQPGAAPVYFDTVLFHNIYKGGQENRISFNPKRVTQNIDLYVGIAKDIDSAQFCIDSVMCELSGIPVKMSLIDGYLDISRTAKMLFWADFVNADHQPIPGDTYGADSTVIHANIDVTGIVPPNNTDLQSGPGILVLKLFTTAINNAGVKRNKVFNISINLFYSLQRANLTQITEDQLHLYHSTGHGEVNVKTNVKLKGTDIVNKSTDEGGLDLWGEGGYVDGTSDLPLEI